MLKHLPNLLTISRLILAPMIAFAMTRISLWLYVELFQAGDPPLSEVDGDWAITALALFVIAALTDLFDGMLARLLKAESKLGRIIDPIADKALVGLPLIILSGIALAIRQPLAFLIVASTTVIVFRDVSMTVLRLTAKDGEGMRVSKLAKYKTAIELVVVGAPLAALAAAAGGFDIAEWMMVSWIGLLMIAAALSAYTAFVYLKPAHPAPKT